MLLVQNSIRTLPSRTNLQRRLVQVRIALKKFDQDQEGASYHLGFTIMLPFYVLLIVFTIELVLLLNAKMAVTHATYAATRAATVWLPADDIPMEKRLGMIQVAAVNALAPVASAKHELDSSRYFQYPQDAPAAWSEAYHKNSKSGHSQEYLESKWRYAAGATRFVIEERSSEFNCQLCIKLEYQHPFHTSGAGKILGSMCEWLGADFPTCTITGRAALEMEGPRSDNKSLGVPFHVEHEFRSRQK